MKKRLLKIIMWFFGILISIMLAIFIAFQVSPSPGAYIINKMFDSPIVITDEETYNQAKKNIAKISDETYESENSDNTFDIYYPKNTLEAVPVLIWVHGGGFVGGDKLGAGEFATKLADEANIAVVTMNYEIAPSSQYPNQVSQVNELIKDLQTKDYKMLNLSKLFFGGDSAGGQIALQYGAIQTNNEYAKQMGMEQVIDKSDIKGTISYCGPVDLKQTAEQHSDNRFMKFFVKTVAWSLIGTKDWKDSSELQEASLVEHVTSEFPPTYITDGNAYSFQEQGMALENKLTELNVPVQGLFYENDEKEISHEYQFDYSLEESKECYAQTLAFVNEYK